MSYSLDLDIQEDLRTFPMYQRLRKINPHAYYSLTAQKQMQSDLVTSVRLHSLSTTLTMFQNPMNLLVLLICQRH